MFNKAEAGCEAPQGNFLSYKFSFKQNEDENKGQEKIYISEDCFDSFCSNATQGYEIGTGLWDIHVFQLEKYANKIRNQGGVIAIGNPVVFGKHAKLLDK